MVIKLPIGDFELGIGIFRIRYWGFKSPILNFKNTIPQFKITNWSFDHQLVISTFSSLITELSSGYLCLDFLRQDLPGNWEI